MLAPHPHRAAVHPLLALPTPEVGAERLTGGAWFAVAGSDAVATAMAERVVSDLGGRAFTVADNDRAAYHAAAVIASNHVVALLGQAERVAASVGVPFEAYLDLVRDHARQRGRSGPGGGADRPGGPRGRGHHRRHLAALDPSEREGYEAMAALARRLAGRPVPERGDA